MDCDIEIKSKLIEQLELSQHRMNQMRQQYEDKLMLLTTKVANTQKERDDILSMIGKTTAKAQNACCPSFNYCSSNRKGRVFDLCCIGILSCCTFPPHSFY